MTISTAASAQDTAEGIRFYVKPRLCVLSEAEETCHDFLEISWKAQDFKSICLFQNNKRLPLRCWENEKGGEHSVEIHTGEDIDFQLKEINDEVLLVSQVYEVIHDQPKFRKRRRNPWSFF